MKLRLGQDVHASDGPFGALGDIIVDPVAKSVTHIVAEPAHKHHQARLVPIWLVHEAGGILVIDLDSAHVRRLERVSYSDYLKLGKAPTGFDSWDIGTQHVFALPYYDLDFDASSSHESADIAYHRVPKGQCEVRRASCVIASDNEMIGYVRGLLVDGDHITAVIVRSELPDFRHDVLVSFGAVEAVRIDEVELTLTKDEFCLLPRTAALGEPDDGLKAHLADLRSKLTRWTARSSTRAGHG